MRTIGILRGIGSLGAGATAVIVLMTMGDASTPSSASAGDERTAVLVAVLVATVAWWGFTSGLELALKGRRPSYAPSTSIVTHVADASTPRDIEANGQVANPQEAAHAPVAPELTGRTDTSVPATNTDRDEVDLRENSRVDPVINLTTASTPEAAIDPTTNTNSDPAINPTAQSASEPEPGSRATAHRAPADIGSEQRPTDVPVDGWYRDPLERHDLRYWKAGAWTTNVVDGDRVSEEVLDSV